MDDDLLIDPHGDPVVEATWVTHFSRSDGDMWAHVVRVLDDTARAWSETMLDESVSDPEGNFQVYVDHETGEDMAVTIRWGPRGPEVCHRDFDPTQLGSPTLTAGHVARLSFTFTGALWQIDYRPDTWQPEDKSWWLGPEFDDDLDKARRRR